MAEQRYSCMCKETTLFSDVLIFRILDTSNIYTSKDQGRKSKLLLVEAKRYMIELNILFFMFLTNVKSMLQYRMM